MGKLDIQLCSETGICSIIKADGSKVDLMPDEVSSLKKALGVPAAARSVIADVDVNFAKSVGPDYWEKRKNILDFRIPPESPLNKEKVADLIGHFFLVQG